MHISELDTPAIVIDLDIMERNLLRMAEYTKLHGLRLRPHTKTHKIPALGSRQLALGAVGLTVAKVSEAEVMLESGVEDLLIVDTGKAASRKAAKSNGRPAGKVRQVFDRVSKLPRRQQEHIVNWVSAYVSQYEQSRQ